MGPAAGVDAGGSAGARGTISTWVRAAARDPLAWTLVASATLVLATFAWWAGGFGDRDLARRATGLATIPTTLIALVLVVRSVRAGGQQRGSVRAWAVGAVSVGLYVGGAVINTVDPWLPWSEAFHNLAPVLELAAYPMAALALSMMPKPRRPRSEGLLFTLDVAIIGCCAAILLWHFVLYPAAVAAHADIVATAGAAAFPVADMGFLFAAAAVLLRGVRPSIALGLSIVCAALALFFAADMVAGIEALQGSYSAGGASGVFYAGAWLALATSVYVQTTIHDEGRPDMKPSPFMRSFVWLPYVAVVVAFVAPAIKSWNDPDLLRQHLPATGILIALVIARLGVTAQQNAGRAAAERKRLAAAVAQTAEAIFMTDAAGNISYVNPAFTRITGYTSADAVGRSPMFLREGTSDAATLADMNATLDRGEIWEGRLGDKRRDGSIVEVDVAIAPLRDGAGDIVGAVEVARDITRERALEAQLAQAQRMEAVGRLAGGIAHDFNNILTAISGFAELALTEVPKDHSVVADIEQIVNAAERAAMLTRSLLAFSRRQVMRPRVLDLNRLVSGLSPMLGRIIGEDVDLVVRTEPDLGSVVADRSQLEQVILNLAVNSRDAMPAGGAITIETANVELDARWVRTHVGTAPGPHVMLSVSDTGMGMTPDVLEHAFEPFFTTKERGKGTGLGLSTVIGIVTQSGGSVDVASEPRRGTVVKVYLPRVAAPAEPERTAGRDPASVGGTEIILVAEDEEAVRVFVERVLRAAGYSVVSATNGLAAREIAADMPRLDLLFTDMIMPGMGGRELAGHLRRDMPSLRVVFASGYNEDGAGGGRNGGDDPIPYLPKPFTADALLQRVRAALDYPAGPPGRG